MTKEEIKKIIEEAFYTDYVFNGEDEIGVDTLDKESLANEILSMIREQALAFATYVMVDYKLSLGPESPILSDEEIYNQFIEQQNKP